VVRKDVPAGIDERSVTVGALVATCETLPALVRGISDEGARRPGQGSDFWSVVDVISHLIDAEHRTLERTKRVRSEENPFLPIYPDDDYTRHPLPELIQRFCSLRRDHLKVLEGLGGAEWDRRGRHERYGALSIWDLARHTVYHDAEHLAQIGRKLPPRVG